SHEGFEFLEDPIAMARSLQKPRAIADIFIFLEEACDGSLKYDLSREMASLSVLTIETFEHWWKQLDFKVRNKIRKATKMGVELRPATLDDDFVRGVEKIYNESPIRQGRRFWHYGKGFTQIKIDLSSFPDR